MLYRTTTPRSGLGAARSTALALEILLLLGSLTAADCSITLRYFDIRGLAEPIRLTLAALDLHWEEISYDRCGKQCPQGIEDWETAKTAGIESSLLPFGQVPSLTHTDTSTGKTVNLVQSMAIQRFLATKYGFYGNSEDEAMMIDVAAGGVADMRAKYSKIVYDPKVHEDPSILQSYKTDYLPTWLGYMNKLLQRAGGEFFGGSSFSFADTMAWDILDHNLRIEPSCLKNFAVLEYFYQTIAHRPEIWKYLQGPRRRGFANGANAFYDTQLSAPAGWGANPPKETGPIKQEL